MMNAAGAVLFTLGLLFLYFAWSNENHEGFLFELIFGPIFIYWGFQLMGVSA